MIVFLDTNVYIRAKYIFDKGNFATLNSYVSQEKITVLYTSATVGEVTKHLEDDITSGIQSYNRVLRKEIPALKGEENYKLSEIPVVEAVRHVKNCLEAFLRLKGINLISLNPLDANKLMDDYFNGVAPFEKKKPNEFKDAIMVNAIRKYQETCDDVVCVVSSDEGFRKAFAGNENFMTFEFLGKFLSYYQNKQEEFVGVESCISAAIEDGAFDSVLKQYFTNLDIDRVSYAQWECNDKEIDDLEGNLSYIEENTGRIYAIIEVEVSLSTEITYRDEDASYYDEEEQQYLIEKYITVLEKHRIITDVRVLCFVDKDEKGLLTLADCKVVEDNHIHTIDLDEDTMYDYITVSTDEHKEPDLEYCSQCGSILGRRGSYFDYDENPLCKHCMKSDSKGDICPTCGRKVPHEYMISGFCINCTKNAD